VRSVLDRVAAGTTKGLRPLTPLAEIKLPGDTDIAGLHNLD
jgi:hypothetical protein